MLSMIKNSKSLKIIASKKLTEPNRRSSIVNQFTILRPVFLSVFSRAAHIPIFVLVPCALALFGHDHTIVELCFLFLYILIILLTPRSTFPQFLLCQVICRSSHSSSTILTLFRIVVTSHTQSSYRVILSTCERFFFCFL